MELVLILLIIFLLLLIGIIVYVKIKVEDFSLKIFGTKDIVEGFKQQEEEFNTTPKSLSGMDSVILPKLNKDFPSLNVAEMKELAENSIMLSFKSIEKLKLEKFPKVSEKFTNSIQDKIEDLILQNNKLSFKDIKIHRSVLNSYTNKKGLCSLIIQSSIEYSVKTNDSEYKKVQRRLNTEFVYVYENSENEHKSLSLSCPKCGAPVSNLGNKKCDYCSTGIVDIAKKTWILNDIKMS